MKKILPVAVLAALAGVNAAQAVHVNPDGTGQVMLWGKVSEHFTPNIAPPGMMITLSNTTGTDIAVLVEVTSESPQHMYASYDNSIVTGSGDYICGSSIYASAGWGLPLGQMYAKVTSARSAVPGATQLPAHYKVPS